MNSDRLEFIEPERIEYLLHQQHLYQAAKAELLRQYQWQYIAFENGVVLDSDRSDRELMPRLYAKYGHRDILVESHIPLVRSPKK